MDAVDLAIVRVLQREGRISNKSLAGRVGLSPSACLTRLRRIERDGLIQGYVARVGREATGPCFDAWVSLTLERKNPQTLVEVKRALADMPAVVEAYEVAAPFDVLMRILMRDLAEWREFEASLGERFGPMGVRANVVIDELKAPSPWPLSLALKP